MDMPCLQVVLLDGRLTEATGRLLQLAYYYNCIQLLMSWYSIIVTYF
jgi:hypothetical protein